MHGLSGVELPRVEGAADTSIVKHEYPSQSAKTQDLHVPIKYCEATW